MNILMLTPYLPYPLLSGGQIRTYNLLKHLSKKHTITLFSFIRSEKEREAIASLKPFCADIQVFLKRPPWSLTSLTLSAVSVYPLVVCMYLKKSLTSAIQEAVAKQKFDLIHAETFYVMPNIPDQSIPTILVEQTIEYMVYQHYTETVPFPPLRWLMNIDVAKIRHWEKTFWQKSTRVVAMSEADKSVMQSRVPGLRVDLSPNGVDTEFFTVRPAAKRPKQKTVLFVGNFKWLQNREAVSILIRDIWPQISARVPDATLWIVGQFPPDEILKYQSDTIRISSDIEDIRDAYKKSSVLLAPIFGPGGTRYKILESMAAGVPVVTTSTGIEGLDAVAGKDAVVADDEAMLAQKTIDVLTNDALYSQLVVNGRHLVEKRFNWEAIAAGLTGIYEHAAYG